MSFDITLINKHIVQASTNTNAEDGQTIYANSTAGAFTLTAPIMPSLGYSFSVYDSHGQFGTNNVLISPGTGQTISGDSNGVNGNSNNAFITFFYNGTEWRHIVLYVGG